jgi:putative colanic acid biosynthesis acetyltransferase WcaF
MTGRTVLFTHEQDSAYSSPWSLRERFRLGVWTIAWSLMCAWTPKPLNRWRVLWLRAFGAKVSGRPFVHQRARIHSPWRVTLHDHACLGDESYLYSLGEVEIMEDATVAQQAYLCTATHKFEDPCRPLQTGKITVGRSAFVGARAFVMPGISIGEGAIVGACSVVTRDVADHQIVSGNPAAAKAGAPARGPGCEASDRSGSWT